MLTVLADLIQRAADALFVPWLILLLFGTAGFAYYMGFNAGRASAEETTAGQAAAR